MYKPTIARTKADGTDDDDPNTTEPPADEIFAVDKDVGFRASLGLATGETADATVWVKNETSGDWCGFAPITGLGPEEMFGDVGLESDVPSARIWIQITNRTDSAALPVYIQAH